jgi:hypothetical protein
MILVNLKQDACLGRSEYTEPFTPSGTGDVQIDMAYGTPPFAAGYRCVAMSV